MGYTVAEIATLSYDEPVRLDTDQLETLYRQLGSAGAENIICRAVEELAIRLSDLAPLHSAGKGGEIERLAHSLIGIADQIGLPSLARVARDVCSCTAAPDEAALAATICRLERIGDKSLMAVWDLEGMSL